jgi:hypothetical protein
VATQLPYQVPRIRFDTHSFVIGVDTLASVILGNHPNQCEDLKLHSEKDEAEVEGIKGGLDIKGTGMFKSHIKDNKGGVHLIKIPNSKYVHDLKMCLLAPHHWTQEAKDHYPVPKRTKAETDDQELMLLWNQQRHRWTIPYHPFTNTPTFYTDMTLRTFCSPLQSHGSTVPPAGARPPNARMTPPQRRIHSRRERAC